MVKRADFVIIKGLETAFTQMPELSVTNGQNVSLKMDAGNHQWINTWQPQREEDIMEIL